MTQAQSINQSPCDICGSLNHRKITHKRHCGIHRCSDCGLIFVCPQPTPEELQKIYSTSDGYFATASIRLADTSPKKANALDSILLNHGLERGRFLDVGCSSGQLIYHMQELGWEVRGNDLNAGALDIARKHQLDVTHGALEDCNYPKSYFDAIHLGDLIEHVFSPRSLLEIIHALLRPGGIVTIVTPNSGSGFARISLLLSRITGISWPHSEAPYHLYEFSPQTITSLLQHTNMEVAAIKYKSGGSFPYMVGNTSYFDGLKKKLKVEGRYRFSWNILWYIPALAVVSAILFPLWGFGIIIDKITSQGRSMLIVAQRIS